ncbi:MAG: sugar phosphate nucleotidyltransferase, partial [Acutalibacteraceae bacterium]
TAKDGFDFMEKSAIILAAGEGKRMKSNLPKPMSQVLNKPMLQWVIDNVRSAGIDRICVVKGFRQEIIEEYIGNLPYEIETVYQEERLGTGHAVMMAKDFLLKNKGDTVILNGDAPFMDSKTLEQSYALHKDLTSSATVISAQVEDPFGYGRIIRDEKGNFLKIVEQKDATSDEIKVNEVNSGGYWFNSEKLLSVLFEIKSENNAKEYYLPDALKLLLKKGERVVAYKTENSATVLGANDPDQLEELNKIAREMFNF